MEAKVCKSCKIEQELSFFYPHKRYKLGVRATCIACNRGNAKLYYKNNFETINIQNKEYYCKNRGKTLKRASALYEKNKDIILSHKKNYRKINSDKIKSLYNAKTNELTESYIIKRLKQGSTLTADDIKEIPYAIEAKRILLKLHRTLKQIKHDKEQ